MKKRIIFCISIIGILFMIAGCGSKNLNVTIKDTAELNEASKVNMTIKKGTLTKTSATIVITDLNENKYSYSDDFKIEEKINGKWKELETMEDFNSTLPLYKVDNNNKLELTINWEDIYGQLKKGEYRIVKVASKYVQNNDSYFEDKDLENKNYYISVEFIINE